MPSLAHEFPSYDFLQLLKPEIEAFQRKVHERVLDPLLRLFALLLELPEDYFAAVGLFVWPHSAVALADAENVQAHAWDRPTEDHLRYMRYIPNPREVDEKLPDKQYLNGHMCVTL